MRIKKKEFPAQKIEVEAAGIVSDYGIATPEPFSDLIDAFGIHTWVYACANLIANAFSMIEFLPYKKAADGTWAVNETHPFRKLLNSPNQNMSGVEFKRLISLSSKLTGNAFIICEPDGSRKPLELWPLQPHKVQVLSDKEHFVSGYVYSVNGHKQSFSAERIIHIREATPTNLQYGQGSLTAVKNAVTSDLFADAWNRYFFGNNGRPDAVLETVNPLEPNAQKRAVEAWNKAYNGPKNRGKVAILSGMKYVEINRLHKDMDFVNLRKMLREEVLAAFGVPQSMVGILDQANYSNMKEQTKVFWNQTMIPEIRKFEGIMTLRAAQITGDDKTIIQADLSTVEALRQDEQAKATVAQTYVAMGIPLSQVVEALDLPFQIEDKQPEQSEGAPDADEQGNEADGGQKSKGFKGDTPKDIAWKKYDRDIAPIEQSLQSSLRAYFRAQGNRVMAAFEQVAPHIVPDNGKAIKSIDDSVNSFFNFDKEKDLFGRTVDPKIRKAYYDFAVRMANGIRGGANFSVDESKAGVWITKKVLKLQQEVTVYTREQLTDAIVESVRDAVGAGLSQSETIDQIRERINETYEFAATSRAERIARTEVIGASNAGGEQAMKDLGAIGKEWLTSRDDRVRDTHAQMDGQVVDINQPFISSDGESLMYPGDQSAGPGAVINCRCTLTPIMEK